MVARSLRLERDWRRRLAMPSAVDRIRQDLSHSRRGRLESQQSQQERTDRMRLRCRKLRQDLAALRTYLTEWSTSYRAASKSAASLTYPNNEYVNGNLDWHGCSRTTHRRRRSSVAKMFSSSEKLTNGIGALLANAASTSRTIGPQYLVSTLASLRPQLSRRCNEGCEGACAIIPLQLLVEKWAQ
jgi:hypothetical protein